MAIYVDFSFALGETHLVAAGWGLRTTIGETFAVRDAAGVLVAEGQGTLFVHVRPDVPDDRAVGFVVVFPLAEAPGDGREATLTFECRSASAAARFTGSALDDFIAFAGDEPFFTLLVEVAAGRLPPLTPAAAALVFERIRSRQRGMVEVPRLAAAVDGAVADRESGIGLALGWILTASPERPIDPSLLVADPSGVRGAEAAFDALPRPDLEGFRHRLSVDGRAGFVATFPVAAAGAAVPLLVLVVASGEQLVVVVEVPETAEFVAVARRYSEVASALDPETRTRLRASLTRRLEAPRLAPLAVPAVTAAPPVLLLEHDGRGRDLREVLAHVADEGFRRFELALSSRVAGSDLKAALDGASRDAPELRFRLLPGDGLAALRNAAADGPVIYVRSSMLMQSDVLPWLASVAEAGLLGRLAVARTARVTVTGDTPAALAAAVARRGLPFAVALGGGGAMRRLVGDGRGLLTIAGRMLWAFGRIPDGLGESRIVDHTLFIGDDSAAGGRFADGRSPHEFDLETIATYR